MVLFNFTHKSYLTSVELQNRQNKTSSHEGVSTETDAELSETAPKRLNFVN